MSGNDPAQNNARSRMRAEHRAIVQASVYAKRSGQLNDGARKPTGGSAAATAIVVVLLVVGILVLALRHG